MRARPLASLGLALGVALGALSAFAEVPAAASDERGAPGGVPGAAADDALLRQLIAETAAQQVKSIDPSWQEAQRDCAGLVRFAYKSAFTRLRPAQTRAPLFLDHQGRPADFADAEALITRSFVPLGRGDEARRALKNGDVLAFRSERGEGEVVWHLMLALVPAPGTEARVIYHPGEAGARVRTGALSALEREAPREWRPLPDNPEFLGFFRYRPFTLSTNGALP